MGTYSGHMWLAPHQSDKLEVQILLDEEAIRITSNGALIGDWAMSDVEIGHVGQNLHLFVEGEQIVIAPTDSRLVPAMLDPSSIEQAAPEPEPDTSQPEPEMPSSSKGTSKKGAHKAKRRMRWKW